MLDRRVKRLNIKKPVLAVGLRSRHSRPYESRHTKPDSSDAVSASLPGNMWKRTPNAPRHYRHSSITTRYGGHGCHYEAVEVSYSHTTPRCVADSRVRTVTQRAPARTFSPTLMSIVRTRPLPMTLEVEPSWSLSVRLFFSSSRVSQTYSQQI
ncbi:hypothetical protein VTO73DRAFT_4554 [Trametes versicolor]